MMITLSIVLASILIILALIHFYWAFGGTRGFADALPTKKTGERVLNPKKTDGAFVGIGLMAFAFLYLVQTPLLPYQLPEWIVKYGSWLIPIVFLLRAIGDFKYVGFFKRIKETDQLWKRN